MDPLSQAVVGATFANSFSKKKEIAKASIIGFLSGMMPDADVFIFSKTDPLFSLEYHRHFTHSLTFIPFGSLIAALLLFYFFRNTLSFKKVWLYSALGYGSHGLLDACTTYGTQLLWPFSNYRVAWNNMPIIDPLYTLPLLFLVIFVIRKKSTMLAKVGLFFLLAYPLLGLIQSQRAESVGLKEALKRGHTPINIDAKPTIGNLLLWRVIYQTKTHHYVDAVKLGFNTKFYSGEKIKKINIEEEFANLPKDSILMNDIKRFNWFSKEHLTWHPKEKNVLGDLRYSFIPNQVSPLWGIEIDLKKPDKHIKRVSFRDLSVKRRNKFIQMIFD